MRTKSTPSGSRTELNLITHDVQVMAVLLDNFLTFSAIEKSKDSEVQEQLELPEQRNAAKDVGKGGGSSLLPLLESLLRCQNKVWYSACFVST